MAKKKEQPAGPKKPKVLEAEIRALLEQPLPDDALRQQLEALATEPAFSGLTYVWGPELYLRNRAMFRPFILNHFAVMFQIDWNWTPVNWKTHADVLDAWFEEVDRRNDVELFRRLYPWKNGGGPWGGSNDSQWGKDLLARFKEAKERYERNQVLNKFDLRGQTLDDKTAVALYDIDPVAARPFILKHPPGQEWGDRKLPQALCERARQQGDDELYFSLYRMRVPQKTWEKDVAAVAEQVQDPVQLVEELEKRHPAGGWGVDMNKGFYALAQGRGRDVVPYLMKHLDSIWSYSYQSKNQNKLLEHARKNGWWDVWSVLVRKGDNDQYNKEVLALVQDKSQPDEVVFRRLVRLSGASSEWNWGRFAFEQVQFLKDATAVALYKRFPELVHGPFRKHLQLNTWQTDDLAKLSAAAFQKDDHVLIDYLASQAILGGRYAYYGYGNRGNKVAERLLTYYEGLGDNPVAFARRVAAVLGQLAAGSVSKHYKTLLEHNALARLFFQESAAALVEDPRSVRDLLEAAEIQVQLLALRVLGQDEERARPLAAANLDLLPATLLRPLHRKSRLLALRALSNAATTPENARNILTRARQALDLPNEDGPEESVLALVAELCQRWPELRGTREQPVVYHSHKKQKVWAR